MYELLKAMEKMNLDECGLAFEAYKLGNDYQHDFGGYCAAFAAGMLYAKKAEQEVSK